MTTLGGRKAGKLFGFSNLAELFKEDNEEGATSVGFAPRFELQEVRKGRGGALSYKAPKTPTQTATFSLEPTTLLTKSVLEPSPTPEPETPETPETPTYTYTDPGDVGYFGMKDYLELARQGASDEVAREYALKAQYGVGPEAARLLGLDPYTKTQGVSTQYPPTSARTITYTDPGDKGYFGMKDVKELRGQGASMDLIKEYAQKAPMGLGPEAAKLLDLPVATQMPTKSSGDELVRMAGEVFNYTDPGDKGYFGMKDYEELAGQGASKDVIKEYAQKASMGVGPEAARLLDLPVATQMPSAPAPAPKPAPRSVQYTYTDPGDKGAFGQKDFEQLASQGVSKEEMRRLASGMQVGPWAKSALGL